MRKGIVFIVISLVLFSACKSNLEAYNLAYQKLKEKEDAQMQAKARTTMNVKLDSVAKDSSVTYRTEDLTLLLGAPKNFLDFNLVARTFINRTNAKGYFDLMREGKYPALLVQNQDQLYRIIVGSFATPEEAESRKAQLAGIFPELTIIVRKK